MTDDMHSADAGDHFMKRAIELSASFRRNRDFTPFGAVVVVHGEIVGEGVSSVVPRHDPTAHAEVLAIRAACLQLRRHQIPEATLYSSSYPCPLCLMACYWADITRVIYAAGLQESALGGFEDGHYYRQLTLPPEERDVRVLSAGNASSELAASIIRDWHTQWQGDEA